MAHAQKHTRTETRTVTEEVTTYTLELSAEEALAVEGALQAYGDRELKDVRSALLNAAVLRSTPPLAVGDRVRILRDWFEGADVRVGDVLTVTYIDDVDIHTDTPRSSAGWSWCLSLNAEGAGWERC